MKNLIKLMLVIILFSCTPEAKEELNAVNNEAIFQKNVEKQYYVRKFVVEAHTGVLIAKNN